MSKRDALSALGLAFATLAYAGACTREPPNRFVRIDGSSTVFPITQAIAASFQKRQPVKVDIEVPVGISGTAGGFKKFCVGKTDISDASRPINAVEARLCAANGVEYVEVPVAYDGLAVVVNGENEWAKDITVEELRRLWAPEAQSRITKWNQVRAAWPDEAIHLYGAGLDSGTYDYFTRAVVQKEHSSRSDFVSSEDDDVLVKGVAEDRLALGFMGFSYYFDNRDELKALAVDDGRDDNGAGAIAPSIESVRNGTYQPLSRPLFIYVSTTAIQRREVELFTAYYLEKASQFVAEVNYVPLPETVYVMAMKRVTARRTGSLFNAAGSEVGVSIEALLGKEQAQETQPQGTPARGTQ